jgi:hypothetical protein
VTDQAGERSRRQILSAAAFGLAGAAVASVARPAPVRGGTDTPQIDEDVDNLTSGTTTVRSSSSVGPALSVFSEPAGSSYANPAGALGILGSSDAGDGVGVVGWGEVSETSGSTGVFGDGDIGVAGSGVVGVQGFGFVGVMGDATPDAVGVYGFTGTDAAPFPAPGVGVLARAQGTNVVALSVIGRAKFSRSGRAVVASGTTSKVVSLAGVTASSLVIVTVASNQARYARVVADAGKFTIYLNTAASGACSVNWIVFG